MGALKLKYYQENKDLESPPNSIFKVLESQTARKETDCKTYQYGFNGMERDDEVKGSGNSYTTTFRQYDPRLGRWFSVDPKADLFAFQSPYVGMDNVPTIKNDKEGDCTICDQLIKHGVIRDPGVLGRNSLNVTSNTTVTDVSYSSGSLIGNAIGYLDPAEKPVKSISETITTSTLQFSETKDKVVITKVTTETIIVLNEQKVVSINKVTTTQKTTLGIQESSYGSTMELDIEWVDVSSYKQSSESVSRNSISEGLNNSLNKTIEQNKGVNKRNLDRYEQMKREGDIEDNFTLPEPSSTPRNDTKEGTKKGG